MFIKKSEESERIDSIILRILDNLEDPLTDEEEYKQNLLYLEKLKQIKRESGINLDNLINTLGSLSSVFLILLFEQKHVLTTKSLGFVSKIRS